MATVTSTAIPDDWTVADMLVQLGDVSPRRVHMSPTPGWATEEDLLAFQARSGRICELVDGVLVEKIMGAPESLLAGFILHLFWQYLEVHDLGIALAPDGLLRILGRQICARTFRSSAGRSLPTGRFRANRFSPWCRTWRSRFFHPATRKVRWRKLRDYFAAGVQRVWYIDPSTRTARAYTAENDGVEFGIGGVLSAGDLLPGFELSLARLFAKLDHGAGDEG